MQLFFDTGVNLYLPTLPLFLLWWVVGACMVSIWIGLSLKGGRPLAPLKRLVPTAIVLSIIWPYWLFDVISHSKKNK